MIGIVIVSHSRKLSDGLKEIADAMSGAPVPIASAGGIDDPENPLGTDGIRILDAIREVMSDEGVLIFADLGSARLNAEMALDLLEPEEQTMVRFCDAPIVEGVLAATVQIAAGGSMEAAMKEARQSVQLEPDEEQPAPAPSNSISRSFTIRTLLGLHARPAALLVRKMNAFAGDIRIANTTKGHKTANAKSINSVMLLEVAANDEISISTGPEQAEAVFAAVEDLIKDNFGEEGIAPAKADPASVPPQDQALAPSGTITQGELSGLSIARGFAIGPIHHVGGALQSAEPVAIENPDAEIERFTKALSEAENQISLAISKAGDNINAHDRKIFDAHISCLRDPDLISAVKTRISSEHICAEAVWREEIIRLSGIYSALEDRLLRERAGDIIDVGRRVLAILSGNQSDDGQMTKPAILAYEELRPSDILSLDHGAVLGICTMLGGETSHAAILASALEIPVVFALGADLAGVPEGQRVLLDGSEARIVIDPDEKTLAKAEQDRKILKDHLSRAEEVRHQPAEMLDGHRVRAAANMASISELEGITASGAEEVGLLRTEFLFMQRDAAPEEDEQYDIYRSIVTGLAGRPLTIRTADIGGDKPVPYLDRPPEDNPNLGWRGIRYSLSMPDFFKTQLAAILRASAHGPVRIMFPLVSTLEEVMAGKAMVRDVMEQLRTRGQSFDAHLEVGLMIEVPAAADLASRFAREVDFLSIGTNDLTQYMLATDRANPNVRSLYDPLHPAVLHMIAKVIRAAHDEGKWVGMCGTLAGDTDALPLLAGLGLDEFSMPPSGIAEFKLALCQLRLRECKTLAETVLQLDTASRVREQLALFRQKQLVQA